jgi:prepilin-type processing-associated H-X9-DG protein
MGPYTKNYSRPDDMWFIRDSDGHHVASAETETLADGILALLTQQGEFRSYLPFNGTFRGDDRTLPVSVKFGQAGMEFCAKGYGNMGMADGHGSPFIVEHYEGHLRLIVWADINQEDPTHTIDLEGAREDARKEDADGEAPTQP